ncbi:ATP-binding cassette domain-containing protein [uncultured Pseudokineococcus sp.]|uniref:ATP-binding cassette domain-containing protein n=1 Tax=uncultured Pseudokineococcus sp. TaxID=1642928 RepID=UPI00261EB229|nr:dipeptide/oligopeptide/nickel ABC transporter ATP-binding protein [uncultured Pseudokineococcus sp.]
MSLLVARDLHVVHRRRRSAPVHALAGVDLSVGAGERVALVGRSGSGKSTLVRALLALQPLDAGDVTCAGRPVRPGRTSALRWYRRLVQYVPQDPALSLDPRASVRDLLAEPVRRLEPGTGRRAQDARVAEVLDAVGLDASLGDRRPGQLSGGQAQRAALARALVTGPQVLLADEPLSGLDPPRRADALALLQRVSREQGTALVVVSHDLAAAAALCERALVLDAGRVVEEGPSGEVLASPSSSAARALVDAAAPVPVG